MIVYTAQKILLFLSVFAVAPHAGSVDRNQKRVCCRKLLPHVAPHAGSVDRNAAVPSTTAKPCTSLPTRGAWIEIAPCCWLSASRWSLPTRGAWIEMLWPPECCPCTASLPTRGAWIEIRPALSSDWTARVAPHAGSVDRNWTRGRATSWMTGSLPTRGAWIEIGLRGQHGVAAPSLPTRGAWIEIRI